LLTWLGSFAPVFIGSGFFSLLFLGVHWSGGRSVQLQPLRAFPRSASLGREWAVLSPFSYSGNSSRREVLFTGTPERVRRPGFRGPGFGGCVPEGVRQWSLYHMLSTSRAPCLKGISGWAHLAYIDNSHTDRLLRFSCI
jgi:hypothetical protein